MCGRGCDRSPPGVPGWPCIQMGVSLPQMLAGVRTLSEPASEPASLGAWGWRSATALGPTSGPWLPHLDRLLFHPRNPNPPRIHRSLVPEPMAHAVTPVPPRGVPHLGGVPTWAEDGAWGPVLPSAGPSRVTVSLGSNSLILPTSYLVFLPLNRL